MALTADNITSLREKMSDVETRRKQFLNSMELVTGEVTQNANYQTFVTGTEVGTKLNENMLKLVETANSLASTEIANAISITNAFLDTQESLNSKDW